MIIYTDGACSGNGSADAVGGYGVVVLDNYNNYLTSHSKRTVGTTNNREELKAILYALIEYGKCTPTPIVYSDSAYAINTLNTWMWGWAAKGWVKSDNKEPENLDLIHFYYDLWNKGYRIDLRKCKGHDGVYWNEVADKLAVAAKEGAQTVTFKVMKYNEPTKNNTIIMKGNE